jgi:hypothetical protein
MYEILIQFHGGGRMTIFSVIISTKSTLMTQQKQEESTFFCENLKIAIVSLFYSTIEWN